MELALTVTRPELIRWLEALPETQRDVQAEQAMALGYQVLTFAQTAATEEASQRFFSPVLESMHRLDKRIGDLMSYSEKSQRLGELGEAIVLQQLTEAMPTDHFQLVSDKKEAADIRATFHTDAGHDTAALIEVKLYNGDVPTAELDKFRRDLAAQHVRFGLFVSLTSRITGIKGMWEVEATDDHVAILLPHAGLSGERLAWGASMLKGLAQFEHRSGRRLTADGVALAWQRLEAHLDELDLVAREVGSLTEALRKAQADMNKTLDALVDQALRSKHRLTSLLADFSFRLQSELSQLPVHGERARLLPPDPDALLRYLGGLGGDGPDTTLRAIVELCQRVHVELHIDEVNPRDLVLHRGGVCLAKTHRRPKQVDVLWYVADDKEVTLLPTLEKLEKEGVVLSGRDAKALLARLEHRLGESSSTRDAQARDQLPSP